MLMKKLVNNLSIFYGENIRLIKNISKREGPEEFPELIKWALQLTYFKENEWIEICRIDNHFHEGIQGTHIHKYKEKMALRKELTLQDAEKEILRISKSILLEEFKENLEYEA